MLGRVTSVPYTSGVDEFVVSEFESKIRNSCAALSWLLSRSPINWADRADRTAVSPEVTVTVVRVKLMDVDVIDDVVELDKLVVDVFVTDELVDSVWLLSVDVVLEVDVDVLLVDEVDIDVLLVSEADFDVLLVTEVDFDVVLVDEVDVTVVLTDVDVVLDIDNDVVLLYVEVAVPVVLEHTDEVVVVVVSTGAMFSGPTDTCRSRGTGKSINCWWRRTMLLFPGSM